MLGAASVDAAGAASVGAASVGGIPFSVTEARVEGPEEAIRARLPLVVRWPGGAAAVEARSGDEGWQVLDERAHAPWITPPLPRGAEVRVRRGEVVVGEGAAAGVWTPVDVAGWAGEGLRGARVVDLSVGGDGLWAGSLGGGLALWDGAGWRHWTRREGLPGEYAIALEAVEDGAWVATDGGLVRVRGGAVARVLGSADGLPDDYTQTVAVDGPVVWAGTWKGLARVAGDEVQTVLSPWSCFALLRGPDERIWVGYEGLRGLPEGEPIEGVPAELHVYDAEALEYGIWLASDTAGLLFLEEGLLEEVWRPPGGAVYAIARPGESLVVAAGDDGVWSVIDEVPRHHGADQGLPSPVANEVIPGPGAKVWVGTDRGVALLDLAGRATSLPLAPLAAGLAARQVVVDRRGVGVASAQGLVWLGGRPPRGWDDLAAAVGQEALGLFRSGRDWWAVGGDAAFRVDHRGRLSRVDLPSPALGGAAVGDSAALATTEGLHWWMPGASQLSPVHPLPGLHDLEPDGLGGLWYATEDEVGLWVAGRLRTWSSIPGPRAVAAWPAGALVASDGGLYRIDLHDGGVTPISEHWAAGVLVEVAIHGASVWAAGEDGRLWGPDPRAPGVVDLDAWLEYAEVLDLSADEHGVWVSTTKGVFRVVR